LQLTDAQKQEKEQALAYEKDVVFSAITSTINQWLSDTDSSYFVGEKVSVADLAVYQQLKQVCVFGKTTVSSEEMPRLSEWYAWID